MAEAHRAGFVPLLGLVLVLILLGALGLSGGTGSGLRHPPSLPATLGSTSRGVIPLNCSGNELAGLTVTPSKIVVVPLNVQMFTAAALSSCGTPLAQVTDFSWQLSSVSLGSLNSTHGTSIAYTACLAPMGGVLHVKSTWGGVTRYANASVSVSGQSPSGGGSFPGPPTGSLGGGAPSASRAFPWEGLGVMIALFAGAAAALLWGRGKGKRGAHGL